MFYFRTQALEHRNRARTRTEGHSLRDSMRRRRILHTLIMVSGKSSNQKLEKNNIREQHGVLCGHLLSNAQLCAQTVAKLAAAAAATNIDDRTIMLYVVSPLDYLYQITNFQLPTRLTIGY